jgi:tetratricopeptide (TPR) repeat protein
MITKLQIVRMSLLLSISPMLCAAQDMQCHDCHEQQASAWQASHHAKSMQIASPASVLGDFNGGGAAHNDSQFTFSRLAQKYIVDIKNPKLETETYQIQYTFGFTPLQQYLIELPGGKLQALPVAWDSRTQSEGGQRWYDLESDLPWDHYGYTWNTSCAECHSTKLEKNYNLDTQSFSTQWQEINVSCTACHGDADSHNEWLNNEQPSSVKYAGFSATLAESGNWALYEGASIASRSSAPPAQQQLSSCAQCHAHRRITDEWALGKTIDNHLDVSLISPPLYYPDGQIHGEVFVAGSFMQSKMHQAGVVCSNCHEPHSLELLADGNGLCTQCHVPAVFDTPIHHGHAQDSSGSQCVDCHMPTTTYMGVDERRDHRFGIPNPQQTINDNIPNACNQCHIDKSPAWAAKSLVQQSAEPIVHDRYAGIFSRHDSQQGLATAELHSIINDAALPSIIRASALIRSNISADHESFITTINQLSDDSPLVRMAAVRAFTSQSLNIKKQYLWALSKDRSKLVRLEVAKMLSPLSTTDPSLGAEQRAHLNTLVKEYETALYINADNPATLLNLSSLYLNTQRPQKAEQALRNAIAIDAKYSPAFINLADLYRAQGQHPMSLSTLIDATVLMPNDASLHYALGLAYFRAKDYQRGVAAISVAVTLDAENANYLYLYAVALEQTGESSQAINKLHRFVDEFAGNRQNLELLVRYEIKYGRAAHAVGHLESWLALEPDSEVARQLHQAASRQIRKPE